VQALGQGVYGLWGPTAAFSLLVISPPSAPQNHVCNQATNGQSTTITNLVFSWHSPANSAGLNGYSYGFDQMPGNITNTVGTNAAINNVTLGTHQFHVKAQDTNGVWGATADFQFTVWAPGTEPPGAPPGLACNVTANGVPTYAANNIVFTWQVPTSENGLAGYSYALNGMPANTVNTMATTATFASVAVGTNNFQVMAKGRNGVWGTVSSFLLIVQQQPDDGGGGKFGPLPPWSLIILTLGLFTVGAWFSCRQKSGFGYQKTEN
jgi:hypothetical protein